MSTEGYVYILTNPVMQGLIKIGKTSRTIEERVKELNGTGVPMPFEVAYSRKVEEMDYVENDMHRYFDTHRVNGEREFFEVNPSHAAHQLDTYQEAMSEEKRRETERLAKEHKLKVNKMVAERRKREFLERETERRAEAKRLEEQNRAYQLNEKIRKTKQKAEELAYAEANKLNDARSDAAFNAFLKSTAFVVISWVGISAILWETGLYKFDNLSLLQAWLMFFAYLAVGWKIGHRLATRNRVHFNLWESLGHYQQSLFN